MTSRLKKKKPNEMERERVLFYFHFFFLHKLLSVLLILSPKKKKRFVTSYSRMSMIVVNYYSLRRDSRLGWVREVHPLLHGVLPSAISSRNPAYVAGEGAAGGRHVDGVDCNGTVLTCQLGDVAVQCWIGIWSHNPGTCFLGIGQCVLLCNKIFF